MNINSKIKKGLSWSFLNQGYSLLSQFTLGIWLARILGPEVYGTVAMVTVFSSLAQMFLDFGFSAALVQKQNVSKEDYSTIFWFNLVVSIIIFVLFFISSNLIADFYGKPELSTYAKVIGAQFVFSAFAITQSVQLTKKIDFKSKTIISILSSIISFALALILAYNGFGVWSIIAQILCNKVISVILLYSLVSWTPMFYFSRRSFNSFYKFGLSVTADTFLNYLARNIDNILIGKYLGDTQLGFYSKSYSIILFPIRNFSAVIKQILFPSFSLIQNDISLIRMYYLKTTGMILYIIPPIMILLSMNAEEIVMILFGKDWISMAPLVEVFSILGIVQSILTLNGTIYLSLGKAALAFKLGLLSTTVSIIAISIGVYLGDIYSVAIALGLAQIIITYPILNTALKLINLNLLSFLKYNYKLFLINALAFAIAYIVKSIVVCSNIFLLVGVISAIYLFIYLLLSNMIKIEPYRFIINRIKTVFSDFFRKEF
jgi:PST family polysaccharide transporter